MFKIRIKKYNIIYQNDEKSGSNSGYYQIISK